MTAEQIYNQHQAADKSSTDRPYRPDHLTMACENIVFIKRGETIWEWYRFMASLSWQSWGIERRIRNKVHFRNGSVETVYAE